MSTTRDGETLMGGGTVQHIHSFRRRLAAAHEQALRRTNVTNQGVLRTLGDCKYSFDLWYDDHVSADGRKFRDGAVRNEEQASRIRKVVDEANGLMLHCEYKLGMQQQSVPGLLPVTEDNCRDDCFSLLQRTITELQHPIATAFAITASIIQSPLSSNNPSTPPAPSPRMATSSASPTVMSSSRVSPASCEELGPHEDSPAYIKQEQRADGPYADLQDRSHERKDSHLMPPHLLKEQQPEQQLPPFSTLHHDSNLTHIPSTRPYSASLLPRPSVYAPTSTNSASSPQSPYSSSSLINGHDQQTVMMSPSVLHPPLSIGPIAAMFPPTSIFYESRPGSKQSPSSPES